MKPLISLDVFDTAIFRSVYRPTDIFNVIEDKVGHNFKALRLEAQNKAWKKKAHCNIIDIYKEIPQFDIKEEVKVELRDCKPNPYILDMYNKEEADFIFISDMYLPANVIANMLKKCGYNNPKVFVSCDYKVSKGDGRLFTKVEEILGRKISKHIGDNYSVDIEGAKKAGIPEVEFVGPPVYQREVITPELQDVRLRKFLIDNELSDRPIEEKIGYQFAPLTLAFTQAVLNEANDNQTIFFNARDSFPMYVVARWILKTKKKIKYCRFSRKSCFVPNLVTSKPLSSPANERSFNFFKIQRIKTVRELLETYDLDENKDYSSILKEYKITIDSNIDLNPKKFDIISKVLFSVQEELYEKAEVAKINFLKYIKRLGMRNNDIFIDMGYSGTMQAMIKRIANVNLKGKYVGTIHDRIGVFQGVKFEASSFFPVDYIKPYRGGMIEFIFSEPAGTVVGYSEKGTPVFYKDFELRKRVTKNIIRGIIQGCRDLFNAGIEVSTSDSMRIIERYFNHPTLEEALVANQRVFENGSEKESIAWFDEEYIKEGKLRQCYSRSYWRAAFKVLMANSKYKLMLGMLK